MERSGSHRISFSSPTRLTGCVVVAWLALALGPLPFEAAEVPTIAKDVEEAALAEAWAKLADTLLGSVSQRSPDAVLRLIKAHACLAVNRNNESLELFASALSDADRRAWERWADAFAAAHPNSAIAWYFWGDALARQKRWRSNEKDPQKAKESPGADECFAEAIRLDPSCYLALNARGVAAHAVGSTLLARVYFLKATKAKEDFADAYASRGTLNVHSRSAMDTERWFNEAKRCSRDAGPAVVLNGLGCAAHTRQKYAEARKYFDAVPEGSELRTLAGRNAVASEFGNLGAAIEKAKKLGVSLRRVEFRGSQGQGFLFQPRDNGLPEDVPEDWGGIIEIGGYVFVGWLWPLGKAESKEPEADIGGGAPVDRDDVDHIVTIKLADGTVVYVVYMKDGSVWVYDPRTKKWRKIKEADRPKEGGQAPSSSVNTEIARELLPSLPGGTGFPGGGGFPGPGGRLPGPGGLPPILTMEFAALTQAVERVSAAVNQQIGARSPTPDLPPAVSSPGKRIGGVDGDVSKIPTYRGQQGVCNVYGLLYAVPTDIPRSKPPDRTK